MDKREQLIDIMRDAAKGETKAVLRARIAALKATNAELTAQVEKAEAKVAELQSIVDEACEARDGAGYLGTSPAETIIDLAERVRAEASAAVKVKPRLGARRRRPIER